MLQVAAQLVPALASHPGGSFAAIVGLGLVLGMRHSTDPDHVVAVSTIVARERSVPQGTLIGALWGVGHTVTIVLVGAAIILFKMAIPPRLGLSMELAVAGMLILLGILNLTGVLNRITHHFTPAPDPSIRMVRTSFGLFHLLRPLFVGLVHGLAGSAAVALLVLSMIPSPAWAVAYLAVFGLGTVLGMMLMTTAMAIPVALTGKGTTRALTVVSGLGSICFGLFLVYQIGFVDGLFTAHVHWTPS
jgi:high-affinity nickel-transport protein